MAETSPDSREHIWSDDRPVRLAKDDKLERNHFAQRVAKELRGWRHKESLVVSLNGDWGSGKTTLAAFIEEFAVKDAEAEQTPKPTFVHFNPWQWSGQGLVIQAFFDQVGTVFEKPDETNREWYAMMADLWDRVKVGTVATAEFASRLQDSITAATAALAGASGVVAGALKSGPGQEFLSYLSLGLLALSSLCAIYAPVAEQLAKLFERDSKKGPELSLEAARAKLKVELGKLCAPVIVVIDDLDRLTKKEVRTVIQLVKVNADFPNLVYLILYQKSIVADALQKVTTESGHDFLKKVVQIELEVPAPPESEMRNMLFGHLNAVLARAEHKWDPTRWSRLFEEIVWPWFETPRDIKRFKGMLEFYFEAHVTKGVLNVNAIDLILLEILRMFAPKAYAEVSRAFQQQRSIFVPQLFELDENRKRFAEVIARLSAESGLDLVGQERLRQLLVELFPQALAKDKVSSEERHDWDRDMRICHAKYFPRYFQLGVVAGDVPAAAVGEVLKSGQTVAEIEMRLRKALKEGSFEKLIERLRTVRDDIPPKSFEPLITALLNVSDELPATTQASFLSSDLELTVAGIAINLLKRIQNEDERAAVAKRAILASSGVTGPVICVGLLGPRKDRPDDTLPVALPVVKEMQDLLVPRMWETARSGRIWQLRRGTYIFYRLAEWSSETEVREWLTEGNQSPTHALAFFMAMLQESQVSGGDRTRQVYTLKAQRLEQFVELNALAKSIEQALRDELAEAAFGRLKEAITLKAAGKPYAEIYVMSRGTDGKLFYDSDDGR